MKIKAKLFTDILKEKGKYSQGRIYLLISAFAYYLTLAILTAAGISPTYQKDLDINNFKMIVDALQYAMVLFAGYVFGGKFVDVVKAFKSEDKVNSENK
tara:strand:- start:3366 stop:3662 length:297 start_codon:yes stop_codon:yes gene_type:complete